MIGPFLTIHDIRNERRDEMRRQRAERREALLDRYGTTEAGWAPCERERLLQAAVAAWREPQAHPFERWTDRLDGQPGASEPTARIREVIGGAIPLPATFAEAQDEDAYWTQRRQDMLDLHDDEAAELLTDALDPIAQVRADIVRELVMHELPTLTLVDLHARFALLRASEISEPETEAALFRDLTSLVEDISTELPPVMSAKLWVTRVGSRRSGIRRASRSAIPRRRSATASSMTPPSEVRRPPSKAAVTFLRPTAGKSKDGTVSSTMAGVARREVDRAWRQHPIPTPPQCVRLRSPPSWPRPSE